MTRTVEIEGFGPITFPVLGKLELRRIRLRACSGPLAGEPSEITDALRTMPTRKARRMRENALLIGRITNPVLSDQEFRDAIAGRAYLIAEMGDVIRGAT